MSKGIGAPRRLRIRTAAPEMRDRPVVAVDMAEYSRQTQTLAELAVQGEQAVFEFTQAISSLFREAMRAVGRDDPKALILEIGDGCLVLVDDAARAEKFAVVVHQRAEKEDKDKAPQHRKYFRIGISSGLVVTQQASLSDGTVVRFKMASTTITRAARLQARSKCGQVLICEETWKRLPKRSRQLYGPQEMIPGKTHDLHGIPAYRRTVVGAGSRTSVPG
jgi:class 3 adenylate cyclase